jgi:exonuclease III
MTERPLTIVSLNVRGLGRDSTKQKLIKTWLSSLQNPPQILLIQEHHLDEQGTTNSTKGIEFWQGRAFWNPGIPMGNSQRISAGTAILVDRVTAPLVKEDGIIIEGRTQFLTLHLPDSTELAIINTYAPRTSRDRATLWKKIGEANFTTKHVIIGGDFNHMEEEEARGKAGERRMHRREAASWHHLTLQYGLLDAWTLDSFRKMSKKEYTFDNGRKGQGSAVSKIDKFLVSQELDARGGRIEAAPSMRKISDHSPLVITIWGRPSSTPTAVKFFDTTLLREDRSRAAILDAWRGTQPPPSLDADWPGWLEAATRRVLACNGRLAREKRQAKGARIRELQHKIRLAEIQLQSNSEDEPVRDILSVAQGHLTNSLQEQVVRNHQLSAATWFRYGDTCSKRFFDFHRIGRKRTLLKELSTEDGDVTGQEDLAHYVRSFYTHLYTSEANAPGTHKAQEVC